MGAIAGIEECLGAGLIALADGLEDGVVVWGAPPEATAPPAGAEDLFLLYANPSAATQGAPEIQDLVGLPLPEAFPPLAETTLPGAILEAIAAGRPRRLEDFRYGDQRVAESDFDLRLYPLDHFRLALFYRNLTQLNRATRAAESLQHQLAQVIDLAPNPTVLHAEGGEILQLSRSWCKLSGYGRDQIEDLQAWTRLAYGMNKDEVDAVISQLYQLEEETREGEFVIRTGDGETRIWDFASAPAGKLPDGRRAVLSMATDITEQRQSAEDLERQVRIRTAGLEHFTRSAAHDLRAPLRAVESFCQIIQEDFGPDLPEGASHLFERVQGAARRMESLLDGLLRLARIDNSELELQEVDLSAQARECVAEALAAHPDWEGEVVVASGLRCTADSALVNRVLANLIGNALKFSSKVASPRVEIGKTPGSRPAEFWIQDNGVGFDPTHAGKLFQVFERLHDARDFEGHGVGLTIVLRIIDLHGGHIEASSQPNEGALFRFTLEPAGRRLGRHAPGGSP